jgi:hypothetical protein
MKNYIGFARDHSGSMSSLAKYAARDYNATTASVREAAIKENQDTVVSVVELGYGRTASVRHVVTNSNVTALEPLAEGAYSASGSGTPLFDAVGALIDEFERKPDARDQNVSFLLMITTDGQENASRSWSASRLMEKIRELQATDRWTFVFRVPRGYSTYLTRFGIPEGNILEWEQTSKGVEVAAVQTTQAFTSYFTARSAGQKSTRSFYVNVADVKPEQIQRALTDISAEVNFWPVATKENDVMVRDFVEKRLKGKPMLKGAAFYQLTKTEDEVQDYKVIMVRDKTTNAVYAGTSEVRQLLGLPTYGTIRLKPGNHGNYDIFIQSTSVNRKLKAGTQVVYWEKVGKPFTEGKSAR